MSRRNSKLSKHADTHPGPSFTSPFEANGVVEVYCFDQSILANREFTSISEQVIANMKHVEACPDVMERKLAKMRKEWAKVKEEFRYAKQHGDRLTESVEKSEKEVQEMLRELERIDLLVEDLFQGHS